MTKQTEQERLAIARARGRALALTQQMQVDGVPDSIPSLPPVVSDIPPDKRDEADRQFTKDQSDMVFWLKFFGIGVPLLILSVLIFPYVIGTAVCMVLVTLGLLLS